MTGRFYLNAKHTDGREMNHLKGTLGKALLFGDLDQARTTALKYLRPGWVISIIQEGITEVGESDVLVEVVE